MEPMLTQDDLKAIGTLIKTEIEPLSERIDRLEETVNVKFDAVQEQLDSIDGRLIGVEASMVTKSYLDDKLAHYVPKPF